MTASSLRGAAAPRVLLVSGESAGGTLRHVAALARGLHGAGVPLAVAAPPRTLARLDVPAGVASVPVPIAERPSPRRDLAALRTLARACEGRDVVHAHGVRAGALMVLATRGPRPGSSRRRRPRIVVTLHNGALGGRAVRAVHRALLAIACAGADAVLAVSGDLLAGVPPRVPVRGRALVPAPDRPTAARPPADVRAELGVAGEAALVLCVARLAPQKGMPLLLAVAEALEDGATRRGVVVALAGDGPLHDEIARRAAELPLRLLGRRDDVADLLAAADVVVMPSSWEGQPLLAQEALHAGAALVATDVGGTREVTGDGAQLIPPAGDLDRDPQAVAATAVPFAAAVARLLDDPSAAAALRDRARDRARSLPRPGDEVTQALEVYRRVGASDPAGAAGG